MDFLNIDTLKVWSVNLCAILFTVALDAARTPISSTQIKEWLSIAALLITIMYTIWQWYVNYLNNRNGGRKK